MKSKILLGLVIAMFFVVMTTFVVSAIDITYQDNPSPGDSHADYPVVKIAEDKFLGIFGGDPISDVELTDNTDVCSVDCYAILKVKLYQTESNFLEDVNFRKAVGNNLEYTSENYNKKIYYLKNVTKEETYTDQVCTSNKTLYMATKQCVGQPGSPTATCVDGTPTPAGSICEWYEPVTKTREVTVSEYVPYTGETLSPGDYYFKITGSKNPDEAIDWVPTIMNTQIEKLAWWNSTTKFGTGVDGELVFTTTTKTYGNLTLNQDYNVVGNTLYLRLNRPYQFTKVTIGPGTILSTQNTTGAVLYIMATQSMNIQGNIQLSNILNAGNNGQQTFTYLGESYTTPTVASGGASCNGRSQGFGAGGGGSSPGFSDTACGQGSITGALGGIGFPSGIFGGNGASYSWHLPGGGGCGASAGVAGNASGGAGGAVYAQLTQTGGTCSNWNVLLSSYGGGGGASYNANGAAAGGSYNCPNNDCHGGGSWGACYWTQGRAGMGGGGAGGAAGRPGVHVTLKSANVTLAGTYNLGGTVGGKGGDGGSSYGFTPNNPSGYSGGGGGGGSGGNLNVYYSNYYNTTATIVQSGASGGLSGNYSSDGSTISKCGGDGGAGSNGAVTLQRAGGTYTTLNSPVNGTQLVIASVNAFNATVESYLTTFTNSTFYLWYSNGTLSQKQTYTLSGTGVKNLIYNVSSNDISDGIYFWNVQACSTDGVLPYCVWGDSNFTFSSFTVQFANSSSFTNPTYEMLNDTFTINATSTGFVNLTAAFMWDGVTPYNTTTSGNNVNATFTATINIPLNSPLGTTQNHTFHWHVFYGGQLKESSPENITVINSQLAFCNFTTNSTLNIPFININYRDETTNAAINATILNSLWNYNIVGSPYTDSLFYNSPSNQTLAQHQFCFSPAFATINATSTYQYGNPGLGYTTKTWPFTYLQLSNQTQTVTLYLINLVDSGTTPVTFVSLNNANNAPIADAQITLFRTIQGQSTLVDTGFTDNAGTISYYVSPITPYTIQATAPGCSPFTSTITPVNSQYNLFMQCNAATALGNVTGVASPIDGLSYYRTPNDGVTPPGTNLYTFTVWSQISPVDRMRFELIDANTNTVVAVNDTITGNSANCTTSYCSISLYYTTATGDNLKGRYFVGVNGTANSNLILLEADAYWRFIQINMNNSVNSFGRLFVNVQEFFDSWGTNTINCRIHTDQPSCSADTACKWVSQPVWDSDASKNYTSTLNICIPSDTVNKIEFSRIVLMFFFFAVFLFIIGRMTGYEMNHPGSFIIGMSIVIWMLSYYKMFLFQGLTQWNFFNQYLYAIATSCVGAGYMFSVIRRYSQ